jgi:hypothetical protein
MRYNILEARIEFKENKLYSITVLADLSGRDRPLTDVRAIYATSMPRSGYTFIMPSDVLNEELLDRVAAQGMTYPSAQIAKLFPGWKKKAQTVAKLLAPTDY